MKSLLTPSSSKKFGEDKAKESVDVEGLGKGDANKFGEFSPAQIQQAKDHVWKHLPAHTKDIIVMEATTDVLAVNGLEIEEIILTASYRR